MAELAESFSPSDAAQRTRLYEAILSSTPDLIYVFDRDYRFLFANKALLEMWGRTLDESLGKPLSELGYEPWHAAMHEREIDQVVATGQPVRGEVAFPHATLGRRIYDYIFVPVFNADGDVEAVAGTTRDITDLKNAEEALRAATRAAEAANKAKSDFLTAMSHELRTPLNAIAGHTQLVAMGVYGAVTESQSQALQRIDRSQNHLLSLINDVLNFAKLEAGRVSYEATAFPVAQIAADAMVMVETQISANSLTCGVEIPADRLVLADRERVAQVLLNLLSNAIKFTEPGGRIWIDLADGDDAQHGFVGLRVSDTGVGIPADKQSLVFDAFVQVHRNLTRNTDGTGLGLAISRDMARAMGGDLRVRSTEGEGSAFTLLLPAAD